MTFEMGGGILQKVNRDTYAFAMKANARQDTSGRWHDGPNTARCKRRNTPPHRSPASDCTCGFYAYGAEQWVSDHPISRHVLAVVSCWGRIIAGTGGLRAEHSRIEALWLSAAVPADLAEKVRKLEDAYDNELLESGSEMD